MLWFRKYFNIAQKVDIPFEDILEATGGPQKSKKDILLLVDLILNVIMKLNLLHQNQI